MKSDFTERFPQINNLLGTKFEIPALHSRIVRRERLTSQFQAGRPVTLLVAPTGYGKTTLLVEWLYTLLSPDWRTSWVTLDVENNSPGSFWTYICAGLQKAHPTSDFSIRQMDRFLSNPDDLAGLNSILNEIVKIPQLIYLILDNYQVITADPIHQSLNYLLDHQPDNLHLILSSRTMPPLSLSRIRAQRRLLEMTPRELAFTPQETRMYLSEIFPLDLTAEQLTEIIHLTRGWIAGLQLVAAAISSGTFPPFYKTADLAARPEIMTYILEEIVYQQPPEMQRFLIETSILPEMCAPLCDFVLDWQKSDQILQQLVQSNLFFYPAEDSKDWATTHPLFSEALQSYFLATAPDRWRSYHQKAFTWLLNQGLLQKAVQHALALGELDPSADVIESCAQQAFIDSNVSEVIHWVNIFPEEALSRHPRLGIFYAMANCMLGNVHLIEPKLKIIERQLQDPEGHPFSPEQGRELILEIQMVRAMEECKYGDSDRGMEQIQHLLDKVPEKDSFFKVMLASFLGESSMQENQLEISIPAFQKALQIAVKYDYALMQVYSRCGLANACKRQAKLYEAELEYQRALDMAVQMNLEADVIAYLQACLLNIAIDRNEQEEAAARVQAIERNLEHLESGSLQWEYRALTLIHLANYHLRSGNIQPASSYFDQVTQLFREHHQPEDYWPVEYIRLQVQFWRMSSHFEEGERWLLNRIRILEAAGHTAPAELTGYAHLLLASGRTEKAAEILHQAVRIAESTGQNEILLEDDLLQAILFKEKADEDSALKAIEKAVQIAAPQGYAWFFIAGGEPIKQLLDMFLDRRTRTPSSGHSQREDFFLQRLISEFDLRPPAAPVPPGESPVYTALITPINEPLSNRETEVLERIANGKSAKEIAADLHISVNTAKTHIRNIHRKFGTISKKSLLNQAEEVLQQMKK